MDYRTLSLTDVTRELSRLAHEAESRFGALDAAQLQWRPDPARWSVGQCLQHLILTNARMFDAADEALAGVGPRTIWHRVPVLARLVGPWLVRSQAPESTRKYRTARWAQPATGGEIDDVVSRFAAQQGEAVSRVDALDQARAAGTILRSPFAPIGYTVLDGWRLIVAHGWRHVEQARRVMGEPGFPASQSDTTSARP
jgi:hypothetical protein